MCYSRGSSEPGSARLGCPKGGLRPAACLRQLPFKATNARFSHITAQGNRVKDLCGEEAGEEVVVPGGHFAFEAQ